MISIAGAARGVETAAISIAGAVRRVESASILIVVAARGAASYGTLLGNAPVRTATRLVLSYTVDATQSALHYPEVA